jgi:hypothetical protein
MINTHMPNEEYIIFSIKTSCKYTKNLPLDIIIRLNITRHLTYLIIPIETSDKS